MSIDIRKKVQDEWDSGIESAKVSLEREKMLKELEAEDPVDKDKRELISLLRSFRGRDMHSSRSHIPYTMGTGEHFYEAVDRHAEEPFTDEQVSDFLDNVAGFSCVQNIIYGLRYWWRPSFTCGPQYGGYAEQIKWHKALAKVSSVLKKKWKDY